MTLESVWVLEEGELVHEYDRTDFRAEADCSKSGLQRGMSAWKRADSSLAETLASVPGGDDCLEIPLED